MVSQKTEVRKRPVADPARLDAATYRCERLAKGAWIAEGPTNTFQYGITANGHVLCCSDSGHVYRLTLRESDQTWGCNCPAAERNDGGCKHTVGFTAVVTAYRMGKALQG